MIRVVVQDALDHADQAGDVQVEPYQARSTWSPLVLYGDAGVGKSYLTQRLAACWSEIAPTRKVSLLTAPDIARSLQRNELADDINRFSAQQKNASFVIIDDVQQLTKKSNADEWLSQLLDYRIRRQKPTVVTCGGPIKAVKLSKRLRSRLLGGCCVRLVLPESGTRRHIIQSALSTLDMADPPDVESLTRLTEGKSVRGIFSHVASLPVQPPSELIAPDPIKLSRAEFVPKVLQTTARQFGVRLNDIKGPSRRKNTVLARAVAMFLLRELTEMSLAEVGKHFRNRDHTTVRHACNKIGELLTQDEGAVGDTISSICQTLHVGLPTRCFASSRDQCA